MSVVVTVVVIVVALHLILLILEHQIQNVVIIKLCQLQQDLVDVFVFFLVVIGAEQETRVQWNALVIAKLNDKAQWDHVIEQQKWLVIAVGSSLFKNSLSHHEMWGLC